MTRKSGVRMFQEPDYLGFFKYQTQPDLRGKYEAVKTGEYDLEKEEVQFIDLLKDLSSKTTKGVGRKFKKVGLLNFVPHSMKGEYQEDKSQRNNGL